MSPHANESSTRYRPKESLSPRAGVVVRHVFDLLENCLHQADFLGVAMDLDPIAMLGYPSTPAGLDVYPSAFLHLSLLAPDVTNVWVDGNFSASGGSGNDIEVYLFDQDAFVNWQNNRPARACYNSGRSTQGKIYAGLPPLAGTYFLIFNNNFSLITPKVVQASATLHYTQSTGM